MQVNKKQAATTGIYVGELVVPRPREQVFEFFADARNLEAITPPWLQFSILTPCPVSMGVGALIDYKLRIHGVPVKWQTEITAWDPPHRFVDEQRRGPYRRWVHEHRFEVCAQGTLMIDNVRYVVPGGRLVDWLFVRRDVTRIFAYRSERLRELFGCQPPVT